MESGKTGIGKQTIGIVVNPRKEQVRPQLAALDGWIKRKNVGHRFLLCAYNSVYVDKTYRHLKQVSQDELRGNADLIVTLGGDGTILSTVQWLRNKAIPILGVNLGGLGFLAETAPEHFLKNLESYLAGQYFLESRALLEGTEKKSDNRFYAFNDIVFDKAGFHRVIEIITKVDGALLNSYIADGLILSSPTGSTGYSLSAGGPIVIPQANVIIINPICPHSLTNRPVVVPDECTIQIQVFSEFDYINVFKDGTQVGNYPSGSSFEVKRADYTVRLVQIKKNAFYPTLRNKLGWGEDFRDKKRWSYQKNKKK